VVGSILDEVKSNYWADTDTLKLFGPQDEAANVAPPAIYWMPLNEGKWQAPKRQGISGVPGALWTRPIELSFLIFGGVTSDPDWVNSHDALDQAAARATMHDTDETERLLANLINAIHRQMGGAFGYSDPGVTWFPPERMGMGMACELTVTIYLPLVREDNPTAPVTTIGITTTMEIT
jgi:hypothetical protein